jgi:hypothetical protein
VTIAGGTLGARLMFRDRGGKFADKAALERAVTEARVPAPAAETRAPAEASKPAADDAPSDPAETEALPSETGAAKKHGKTKHRVVLKAVADVKKLRKTATKAEPNRTVENNRRTRADVGKLLGTPEAKSPMRDDELTELDKIARGVRGGKPTPATRPAGSPDGGATGAQPPKRK